MLLLSLLVEAILQPSCAVRGVILGLKITSGTAGDSLTGFAMRMCDLKECVDVLYARAAAVVMRMHLYG